MSAKAAAVLAAVAAAAGLVPGGAAEAATWNGGVGTWNTAGNWTGGVPNSAGATALIDGGKAGASTVTLDISPSISSLTVDAGDSLVIANGRTLTLSGGATVNGLVTITSNGGSNAAMVFNGGPQTLGGSGPIAFGGPSFTLGNSIGGSAALTIGPALTVRTDVEGGTLNPVSLTNKGLIHAQTNGRILTVGGGAMVNQGTIRCSAGLLVIESTSWTNAGRIELINGGLILNGAFTTAGLNLPGFVRTGGTLFVRGTLDNTGAVLPLSNATGSFTLTTTGTIKGGTVTSADGRLLFVGNSDSGKLDGVTLQSDLRVNDGGTLTIANSVQVGANSAIVLDGTGNKTSIVFDGPQAISGSGQLRFEGSAATNEVNGTGPLTIGPGVTVQDLFSSKGATFNVAAITNQGVLAAHNEDAVITVNTPAFVSNGTVLADFGATMVLANGVNGTGTVIAGPSGTVRAAFVRQDALVVKGPTVDAPSPGRVTINAKAQGGQTSVVKSLTFDLDGANKPLGTLDLTDTALAVDYTGASPMAAVRAALLNGRAGGTWTGTGITSSLAAANASNRTLGFAEAADALGAAGGTFAGRQVDGSAVLVRYTLFGDATLDGLVDFNDLVKLAQNYNTTVSSATDGWWGRGDFTYDGVVDFNDLVKLAQNYNTALAAGPVPGAPAGFAADVAAAFASVPEPIAPTAIVGCGLFGSLRRRRLAKR